MNKLLRGFVMAALVSPIAGPAQAHHSLSAYNISKTIELDGTVTSFEWSSPHCWLFLHAPNGHGGYADWALEAGTPVVNYHYGWKRNDFKPGDKLKVIAFPVRDGSNHGAIASVIFADGRRLEGPLSSYLKK